MSQSYQTLGDRYYYKGKNKRYELVDGERKAWELRTCIKRYALLRPAVIANLEFFIGLRNKIEHRHLAKHELDTLIFGECQSLLYNYETILVRLFGEAYALHESLAFSLQFSQMRTDEQLAANRRALTRELGDLHAYVEQYRSALPVDVFNSCEYSVKLIQVPKVSNTNRNDLAVEFVKWSEVKEEDQAKFEHLVTLVKDAIVKQEVINPGKLKPGDVVQGVAERTSANFTQYDHRCFYTIFSVRPPGNAPDPAKTDARFCHYDEVHRDYVYQERWVDFIVGMISSGRVSREEAKRRFKAGETMRIADFKG